MAVDNGPKASTPLESLGKTESGRPTETTMAPTDVEHIIQSRLRDFTYLKDDPSLIEVVEVAWQRRHSLTSSFSDEEAAELRTTAQRFEWLLRTNLRVAQGGGMSGNQPQPSPTPKQRRTALTGFKALTRALDDHRRRRQREHNLYASPHGRKTDSQIEEDSFKQSNENPGTDIFITKSGDEPVGALTTTTSTSNAANNLASTRILADESHSPPFYTNNREPSASNVDSPNPNKKTLNDTQSISLVAQLCDSQPRPSPLREGIVMRSSPPPTSEASRSPPKKALLASARRKFSTAPLNPESDASVPTETSDAATASRDTSDNTTPQAVPQQEVAESSPQCKIAPDSVLKQREAAAVGNAVSNAHYVTPSKQVSTRSALERVSMRMDTAAATAVCGHSSSDSSSNVFGIETAALTSPSTAEPVMLAPSQSSTRNEEHENEANTTLRPTDSQALPGKEATLCPQMTADSTTQIFQHSNSGGHVLNENVAASPSTTLDAPSVHNSPTSTEPDGQLLNGSAQYLEQKCRKQKRKLPRNLGIHPQSTSRILFLRECHKNPFSGCWESRDRGTFQAFIDPLPMPVDNEVVQVCNHLCMRESSLKVDCILSMMKTSSSVRIEDHGKHLVGGHPAARTAACIFVQPNVLVDRGLTCKMQQCQWGVPKRPEVMQDGELRLLLWALPVCPEDQHRGHLWPKGSFVQLASDGAKPRPIRLNQRVYQRANSDKWEGACEPLDLTACIRDWNKLIKLGMIFHDNDPYYLCLALCRYQCPEDLTSLDQGGQQLLPSSLQGGPYGNGHHTTDGIAANDKPEICLRHKTVTLQDLPVEVQAALQNLVATGHIEKAPDKGVLGIINNLPEQLALSALNKFRTRVANSPHRHRMAYLVELLTDRPKLPSATLQDLSKAVQTAVQNLVATGQLETMPNDRILGMLFDLPEIDTLHTLKTFSARDKSSMRNPEACLFGALCYVLKMTPPEQRAHHIYSHWYQDDQQRSNHYRSQRTSLPPRDNCYSPGGQWKKMRQGQCTFPVDDHCNDAKLHASRQDDDDVDDIQGNAKRFRMHSTSSDDSSLLL